MTVPVWAIALGIAAVAPFAARALATTFERHARAKSRRIVEGAQRHDNGGERELGS